MKRLAYLLLGLILLAGLAPGAAVIWSTRFAQRHGCTVHEGYVTPCLVDGVDYGDQLYAAFVSGWLLLFTLPISLISALILLGMGLLDLLRWRRRRRAG